MFPLADSPSFLYLREVSARINHSNHLLIIIVFLLQVYRPNAAAKPLLCHGKYPLHPCLSNPQTPNQSSPEASHLVVFAPPPAIDQFKFCNFNPAITLQYQFNFVFFFCRFGSSKLWPPPWTPLLNSNHAGVAISHRCNYPVPCTCKLLIIINHGRWTHLPSSLPATPLFQRRRKSQTCKQNSNQSPIS